MALTTCTHCGYERHECTCGKKRNTSGDIIAYQNYTDYRGFSDYATTRRISHEEAKQKYMAELHPLDGERLQDFFKRTSKHIHELNEYSSQHHLVGTKKGAWQCHTSSRYCFICVQIQLTDLLKTIIDNLEYDKNTTFTVKTAPNTPDTFMLSSQHTPN